MTRLRSLRRIVRTRWSDLRSTELAQIRQRSRQLGLPKIRLHDLRHGWATMALAAGVHPKVVQERRGHASISITLDTYSHVSPALHGEAAETVAALVFGVPR